MPFPSPKDLPDPGIKPASLGSPALAGGFFITEPAGKFTETESRRVAASHWDGGWEGRGSFYLMSIEFQFRKSYQGENQDKFGILTFMLPFFQ